MGHVLVYSHLSLFVFVVCVLLVLVRSYWGIVILFVVVHKYIHLKYIFRDVNLHRHIYKPISENNYAFYLILEVFLLVDLFFLLVDLLCLFMKEYLSRLISSIFQSWFFDLGWFLFRLDNRAGLHTSQLYEIVNKVFI